MTGEPQPPDLKEFSDRLRKAQGAEVPDPRLSRPFAPRGMGVAFRVATELVAALVVGGGFGWLLDGWLNTRPWLFLVFLTFGFASGIITAFRAASRISAEADTPGN